MALLRGYGHTPMATHLHAFMTSIPLESSPPTGERAAVGLIDTGMLEEPTLPTTPLPRLRTYIVEDSVVIRESLIALLEELGPIEVVGTAEDEATAVQWLSKPDNQFDLVIVDIFLKTGSGLGVLRAVQALAGPQSVVVLSNYATRDIRRKCLELGASRVFDKSNEIEALMLYCSRLQSGVTGPGELT